MGIGDFQVSIFSENPIFQLCSYIIYLRKISRVLNPKNRPCVRNEIFTGDKIRGTYKMGLGILGSRAEVGFRCFLFADILQTVSRSA